MDIDFLSMQPNVPSFIAPWNVENVASYIDSSAIIGDRVIAFGPGNSGEILLAIHLACPGELKRSSSIHVTVGLDVSTLNEAGADINFRIGLEDDLESRNLFVVPDINKYNNQPPCYFLNAVHDDNRVSGIRAPAQVTLDFVPGSRFGTCYTAQSGGFSNTGTFNDQIDLLERVTLVVRRDNAAEQHRIYYLKIDFS